MILDGSGGQFPRAQAPHLYLLPYLDQASMYARINLLLVADRNIVIVPGVNDQNEPVVQSILPVFICPSDPETIINRRNNYRASVGITAFPRYLPSERGESPGLSGAFHPVTQALHSQHFFDGLSTTAAFSERVGGSGVPSAASSCRDLWLVGVSQANTIWRSVDREALQVQACRKRNAGPALDVSLGQFWFYAGFDDTWYNHIFAPNSSIPDCGQVYGFDGSAVMSARSAHPGVVNCLMMDGAVRLVASAVDEQIWQAIGTRAGADPYSMD